jgi:aminocarboxymuconate-semialdehyde decarboxylase
LGSDYPFPLGEQRVGALVRKTRHVPEASKARVLGGNAARFFGIA